jgi:hypothetical protein
MRKEVNFDNLTSYFFFSTSYNDHHLFFSQFVIWPVLLTCGSKAGDDPQVAAGLAEGVRKGPATDRPHLQQEKKISFARRN